MKGLFYLIFFVSSFVMADCNQKLTGHVGALLEELEVNNLQSYQTPKLCELLSQELSLCSKEQLLKLNKEFSIKKVQGYYCQPHLPPFPKLYKKNYMKGASLYSWKEKNGYLWYALFPGKNSVYSVKELLGNKIDLSYLKQLLNQMPKGIELFWNPKNNDEPLKALNLALPEKIIILQVQDVTKAREIILNI